MIQLTEQDDRLCERCRCCDRVWEECPYCGGDGGRNGDDLMEEDPLWYGPDDFEVCDACNGQGGHWGCIGNCDENGKHAHRIDSPEQKKIK